MATPGGRKLTRKRIRMQTVRFEKQSEEDRWARLGGAELVAYMAQARKPLTHRPLAALGSIKL